MVNRCIECGKIIDPSRIYCKKCEKTVKDRIEKKKLIQKKKINSDFFERLRLE